MNARITIILSTLVLAVGLPNARAQTVDLPYTGFLEQDGAPVNGPVDLTFELYDAPANGNLVSRYGPLTVEIRQGEFVVDLVTPLAALNRIDPLYLAIVLHDAGGDVAMQGRQRLGAHLLAGGSYDGDAFIIRNPTDTDPLRALVLGWGGDAQRPASVIYNQAAAPQLHLGTVDGAQPVHVFDHLRTFGNMSAGDGLSTQDLTVLGAASGSQASLQATTAAAATVWVWTLNQAGNQYEWRKPLALVHVDMNGRTEGDLEGFPADEWTAAMVGFHVGGAELDADDTKDPLFGATVEKNLGSGLWKVKVFYPVFGQALWHVDVLMIHRSLVHDDGFGR